MVIGWWDLLVNARFGELVVFIEDFCFVEVIKDAHHTATIPVVCHTTSIVNVSSSVHQHLSTEDNLDVRTSIHSALSCLLSQRPYTLPIPAFIVNEMLMFNLDLETLTLNGISLYSIRNILSWLTQILRSPSVNSYGMLKPRAPNFLLSIATPWKKHRESRRCLNSTLCKTDIGQGWVKVIVWLW